MSIKAFPIPEATARRIAAELNSGKKNPVARVVGRGQTCFVEHRKTQTVRPRNSGGPRMQADIIEMIGTEER